MEAYRYIIRCQRMPREQVFIAASHVDFMRQLTDYISGFGPVDLLYCVGKL